MNRKCILLASPIYLFSPFFLFLSSLGGSGTTSAGLPSALLYSATLRDPTYAEATAPSSPGALPSSSVGWGWLRVRCWGVQFHPGP